MEKHNSILVVDDNNDFRLLISSILRESGYHVWEANCGKEGLKLVRSKRPDLVLLDVQLPDVDGMEVCRQIKNDPKLIDVFVALCSGNAINDDSKVSGLQTGADDYIVKPLSMREMIARIRTLMRLRNTTAALRASEEHHKSLINILPDAVCQLDPKGRLLKVNSQTLKMLGYDDSAELLEKNIFDITPESEHKKIKSDIDAAMHSGIIRCVEYVLLRKDGTELPAELSAVVSLSVDRQNPVTLLSVTRDISERKEAQSAIRASEERFRQLADHINEVFWIRDAHEGRIIYVGPAYAKVWGRPCDELYNSPDGWIPTVHPKDRTRVAANVKKKITGDYDETYRIIRPDGTVRWIQDRAFPIRDAKGKIYRIVGIADDITKRKEAWDFLYESEARKKAIMQTSLDGIITINHDGVIVEVNSAAEKMFALGQSKLVGEKILEIIPPSFKDWFHAGLMNSFAGAKGPTQGSRIEMPALRGDGNRFSAEFTISAIMLNGEHPMFTLYIRDITQLQRAMSELRALPQRIIKAQEDERSRIAQELHDGINQSIASVKMRLSKVATPELKPSTREILHRCDDLLVRVLEENRRIAHNLRPVELDNLGLATACTNLCKQVHARSNIEFDCEMIPVTKRLQPELELNIFRILQEAINNIEKHAQAKQVKVRIRTRQNEIILKIQDDGCGFTPRTVANKSSRRQGLGLTNMRERALSMGGNCEIKSSLKRGTVVVARFPLNAPEKKNATKILDAVV